MTHLKLKKILIGVDGSEYSMNAVSYISQLVRKEDVEVVLYHAVRKINEAFFDFGVQPISKESLNEISVWETSQKHSIKDFMGEAYDILTQAGFDDRQVHIKIHPRKAGIARDIVEEAHKGYSAVVIGRKGISKIKDLILGSIAIKLIEKLSHIPVCVVGSAPNADNILLGIDTSEGSQRAIAYLKYFFPLSPEQITLLKVFRGIDVFQQESYTFDFPEYQYLVNEAMNTITPVMERAEQQLIDDGFNPFTIKTKIIRNEHSRAAAIVEEAKRGRYGTIVLGRRGISKVEAFLMGRVSNKVIHIAHDMAVWIIS